MNSRIIDKLVRFGHLAVEHRDDIVAIGGAVISFLKFYGVATPEILSTPQATLERLLEAPRCGCTDAQALGTGVCKWDAAQTPVKVFIGDLPGMTKADWQTAIERATEAWEEVCGITFAQTFNRGEANIVIVDARIDGGSNVLADMELPCGKQRQPGAFLTLRADRERWSITGAPGSIAADITMRHEFGHAIGLSHVGFNEGTALMNPTLNPNVPKPTPVDIRLAQALYGPPRPKTPTPPAPPVPPTTPTPPTTPATISVQIVNPGPTTRVLVNGRDVTPAL